MIVLMDLEWVENGMGHCSPTQVAARRVDSAWNTVDDFYARMRPRDKAFHQWNHVAYSGGTPEDFLYAKSGFSVLSNLRAWLRPDDILCWWFGEAREVFQKINALVLKEKATQQSRLLNDYVVRFLAGKKPGGGNPYKLAAAYNIPTPSPMHDSRNDIEVMQAVLQGIHFPQSEIYVPLQKAVKGPSICLDDHPYQYEAETGLIHKRGCAHICDGATLNGFATLKSSLKHGYKPCPYCVEADYRTARRERNKDIIKRANFNFVYTPSSQAFHRYDCPLVLPATDIVGSVYYKKCADTGRRPCKFCHPTQSDELRPIRNQPPKRQSDPVERQSPPKKQKEAYKRLRQAQEERRSSLSVEGLTETEKEDIFTLTMTRYGFWAGAGYQNFHLRNCPKLKGLTNIRGFSRYQDAVHAGFTPCKWCKPTSKNDVVYSIPIKSQRRKDESVDDLVALCKQYEYSYEKNKTYFTILTPVGRWRIHLTTMPIALDHLNLTNTPDNPYLYHRQPKMFLSLLDAFQYIHRHDQKLQERGALVIFRTG